LRSPINNVYRHNNFQRPPDQRELVIIDLKWKVALSLNTGPPLNRALGNSLDAYPLGPLPLLELLSYVRG
jgi:hypothetical protein